MKLCPLTATWSTLHDCKEDECAWWDEADQMCAVLAVSIKLTGLESYILHRLFPADHSD